MRTYNRRLAAMARSRRMRNKLGRRNDRQRFMFGGYTFEKGSSIPILKSIAMWAFLELTEGWRTWFQSRPVSASKAAAAPLPEIA
jgi:hypothetical protein